MCKVFQLPGFVHCKSVQRVKGSKCRENSITLRRYYYHNNERRNDAVVGKDTSVNCLSVRDLVREVTRYTSDNIIYLATNEVNFSRVELDYLQQARIQIIDPRVAGYRVGSVAAAVVDVQLMLDATTFLGWGVSLIHDVVEHARMVQNKSWCTTVETNVTYPKWCWLQAQRVEQARVRKHRNLSMPPYSALQRRVILLHADRHMRTQPLVLSKYNISKMPAYQFEIEDFARRMRNLV
eukprot:gene20166-22916_t